MFDISIFHLNPVKHREEKFILLFLLKWTIFRPRKMFKNPSFVDAREISVNPPEEIV